MSQTVWEPGRETNEKNMVGSHMQSTMNKIGDNEPATDLIKSCDDHNETFVAPVHPSWDKDDIETIITQTKSYEPVKDRPKARVDFYDFAGQLFFHASHPTFLFSRAIYILAFDINKFNEENKSKNVEEIHMNKSSERNRGTITDTDSIFF